MEKRAVLPGKHGCWFYVDSVVAMDNRTSLDLSPTVTLVNGDVIEVNEKVIEVLLKQYSTTILI